MALVGFCFLLAACASQPSLEHDQGPGFFMGLVHGFCAPFAFAGGLLGWLLSLVQSVLVLGLAKLANAPMLGFVAGLLDAAVDLFSGMRIYSFPNDGLRYDLGFLIGFGAWGVRW